MSDDEIVKDFLAESYENLDRLDRELVALEKKPNDREALASVFRTIHTIKGTCGFLGFNKLERVAHVGESLLTLLRDAKLSLNPEITTGLLGMVDAVRYMLGEIQSNGKDGNNDYPELLERLTRLQTAGPSSKPVPAKAKHEIPKAAVNLNPAPAKVAALVIAAPEKEAPVIIAAPENSSVPPKVEATPAPEAVDSRPKDTASDTIRVGVNTLDKLMTLVGELVLARNQLLQYSNAVEDTALQTVSQRMNLIATELQGEVMKTRMQPIGNIWNQFPRTVRDVALGCGKEVAIEMEGKETEIDKTIIEAIKDPLTHLVRNAVDHGIELPEVRVKIGKPRVGRLTLRAYHEGGQVNIEIKDDGAGLNRERIRQKAIERKLITPEQSLRMTDRELYNLIFLPGFSTAEKVTNVSGRGVGMDVVKTNVEKIGGMVDVQSTPGHGSTVRVKIPLTLAIIPALVVTCAGERYAIPQVNLTELVRVEGGSSGKRIEMVHGAPVYRLRGRLLPLVYLSQELQLRRDEHAVIVENGPVNIAVLQAGDRLFGLAVDEVNDTQEIVVKPLRKQLKGIKSFAGASIMGDGRIALILDVMGVAQRSGVISDARDAAIAEKTAESAENVKEMQTFLLFAGPDDARMAVPISTLDRLEEFPMSQVERSGKQLLAQYRGRLLPLVQLSTALEERRVELHHPPPAGLPVNTEMLQVLVCHHEGQALGIVVDRILDIVDDEADVKFPASRSCVVYSAVINSRVTELIDLAAIVQGAGLQQSNLLEHAEVTQ